MLTRNILVGIDCLLDTMLACLGSYSPEQTKNLLLSGEYHRRRHNQFERLLPGFDKEAFAEVYKQRDKAILRQAVATPIIGMLKELAAECRLNLKTVPVATKVELAINLWPFKLDIQEQLALAEGFTEATLITKVMCCSLHPLNLTPGYLTQYSDVIHYDYNGWLTTHSEAVKTKVMKSTTFICPEIIMDSKEDISKIPVNGPANETKLLMAEYMSIEILPLHVFSLLPPKLPN